VHQERAEHNPCRSHAHEDRENEDVVVAHGAHDSEKANYVRCRLLPAEHAAGRDEGNRPMMGELPHSSRSRQVAGKTFALQRKASNHRPQKNSAICNWRRRNNGICRLTDSSFGNRRGDVRACGFATREILAPSWPALEYASPRRSSSEARDSTYWASAIPTSQHS
jgi:hypothetical protein